MMKRIGTIHETEVYGVKAYYGRCECGHETQRFDRERQAVAALTRHHEKELTKDLTTDADRV